MTKQSLILRNVVAIAICLAGFSVNSVLAQTTFSYTDPATGVTGTYGYNPGGYDCPTGQTCVALLDVTFVPATLEILPFPETVSDGMNNYHVISMTGTVTSNNYPNVKEIIYPNSTVTINQSWTGVNGGNGFPNVRKVTYGKNTREFFYSLADLQLDTVVFLGDKVLDANSNYRIYGSFRNVPPSVKIMIPCGTMSKFITSVNDPQFGGGIGAWTHWADITASCFVEALCLNTLTILSSDNNLGNARSYSIGGNLITFTPSNTSATFSGTAELIAIPQGGKVFIGWNDGNVTNPRTVTVSSDTTFTANFATCENVGIKSINAESPLKVYPNPTNNTLYVELERFVNNGTLTLFDMSGKLVLSQAVNGNSAQINLSALTAGNYILRLVENGTASVGVQVIKQ